jgi:plastocyanin
VRLQRCSAPARLLRKCAGAFVLVLFVTSCENASLIGDKKDRTLELAADTIDVPEGVDLHDVKLVTDPQSKDFEPAQLRAAPGDYVRFTTGDSRTHAIVFDAPASEIRSFLESTGQLRSPPLVTKGASWVIALDKAPPGTYVFRCLMHNHSGQLTVAAR